MMANVLNGVYRSYEKRGNEGAWLPVWPIASRVHKHGERAGRLRSAGEEKPVTVTYACRDSVKTSDLKEKGETRAATAEARES